MPRPAPHHSAPRRAAATESAFRTSGQVLYRNVFQPVRREVEGRKDFERRLADRKKERLCSRAGGRAQGREEVCV